MGAPMRRTGHCAKNDDEPFWPVSMALWYEGWNITTAGDEQASQGGLPPARPDVVVPDVMLS